MIIRTISSGVRLAGFPSEYNLVIKAMLFLVILVLLSPRIAREWAFWPADCAVTARQKEPDNEIPRSAALCHQRDYPDRIGDLLAASTFWSDR